MNHTFYEIAVIFFAYSFLAWLAETAVATVRVKDFRNRGFASGPFCFLYGFTGVLLAVFLQELRDDILFLFLGSTVVATAVEWFAGKMLERMKHKKWWDYSGKKWNFDGYICLQYSLIWGVLGFLAVRHGNGIILGLYHSLPVIVGKTAVWGLAIALVTVLLYKDRDKQEHHIFWVGVFLGGAYEYICSVFTEIVFGKVFWDYSAMPFNLGGRINLLYCLFWGIAAVVWIKGLYPKVARFIEAVLRKTGWLLTGIFMAFMVINICVSVLALVRYDTRADGETAVYGWELFMDEHFDDARMERIYPNAIRQ